MQTMPNQQFSTVFTKKYSTLHALKVEKFPFNQTPLFV